MMRRERTIVPSVAVLLCVSALIALRCGTSGDLAGGSGAGNPGVTASVSIMADTGLGAPPLSRASIDGIDGGRTVPLVDDDGLVLTASSALVTVYAIHFILEDSEDCEALLDSFDGDLVCDSENIVLPGPFVFDAVTGNADSLFDTLQLPSARYRGMKLVVGCEGDADSSRCRPVEIFGTFEYRGETRVFDFQIDFSDRPLYHYTGPPQLLEPADTALFSVTLDVSSWLDSVDVAADLDAGTIALDSTGTLVIDSGASPAQGRDIINAVRKNLRDAFAGAEFDLVKSP
ncbi:MAG: hypothetical protein GF418_04555 [Chitinivibrionales bacterium]|nr:hypothetical protein [Chitinivibrionales bacterium]MBD3394879.1 hypothetical protein [Chitinivibrionales bacterium]